WMGRDAAFVCSPPPLPSFVVGIGNGLGYSFILIVLGAVRELFGSGSLLGYQIIPLVSDGGWYLQNGMLLLPPSAFFIIGFIIWTLRAWKPEQVEEEDFKIAPNSRASDVL